VLELRPASAADVKATARTKRTLANVLADFGDGLAMAAPEEFEAIVQVHTLVPACAVCS